MNKNTNAATNAYDPMTSVPLAPNGQETSLNGCSHANSHVGSGHPGPMDGLTQLHEHVNGSHKVVHANVSFTAQDAGSGLHTASH